MSYYRRLIEESEKQRILGLHNRVKKNPTTRLLKEAPSDFRFCVRNAGTERVDSIGVKFIEVKNGGGKGKDYHWRIDGFFQVWDNNLKDDAGEQGAFQTFSDGLKYRIYHCKCVSGKCVVQSYSANEKYRPHECDEKKTCNTQQGTTTGNQQGTAPGGQTGGDCSKNPMDLAMRMGLNWKETRQKWIDAKCNGTTPCILGDATTNINLRNALCKGTWNPKTDGGTQTPTGGQTGEQPKDGGTQTPTGGQTGGQTGTEDKKYSEEYITPTFEQTPKAD